jgi:hypothetical protein
MVKGSLCNPNGTLCLRRTLGTMSVLFCFVSVVFNWNHELLDKIFYGGVVLIGLTTADLFSVKKALKDELNSE